MGIVKPKEYRARSLRAYGIGLVLVGKYQPHANSCENKKRYSFNSALDSAGDIWERGDFLLVSIFVVSVAITMWGIVLANLANNIKNVCASGVVTGLDQTNVGININ